MVNLGKRWNQGFCGAMGSYAFENLKLFWINLKHYSQRPQVLSPSKQIPLQSLLYKTTATFILSSKWKKAHLKQPLINYFCKKSSTIDFWFGSKSGSCQYGQKSSHLEDISSVL